jgi:hypothetical protein
LTKTDDLQLEFRRTFASYLDGFFPFEYEDKTYRLVNSYIASPWRRCDVCGNSPIKYVSVIRGSDGRELHVGKICIDSLTNRKASDWFRSFWMKLDNVIRNRKYIDGLDSLLTAFRNRELEFQITREDAQKLQKTLARMSRGINPTRKQQQLADLYIKKLLKQ